MGRNVFAQGTPDRSFAGLMDHLTGFSREGASGSDGHSDFGATFRRTSNPETAAVDESLTNPRNGARPMLPVTERKPGRATPQTEATALSYEMALQIHGRRRSPPPPPAVRTAPTAQSRQTAASTREDAAAGARKASNAKAVASRLKEDAAPPKPGIASARSGVGSSPHVSRNAKPPVAPSIQAEARNGQTPASHGIGVKAHFAPGVQRKKTARTNPVLAPAEETAPRAPASAGEVRDASKSRRKGKPPGKVRREVHENAAAAASRSQPSHSRAAERDALPEQIHPLESAIELMESASPNNQLELLQAFGQLDQFAQRRTIVSVRLTEGEFACLRDRAEESGISVSAYMRSCVVDAEQLRAQVKRALAEMRALTASAGTGPGVEPGAESGAGLGAKPGTALTASGFKPGEPSETSGWNAHGWFRRALRPLAFLFGPLFPARRSV